MKHKTLAVAAIVSAIALSSCGKPQLEVYEEIEPNETAFVIPLEDNADAQAKFESIDYLEKQRVAAKRIQTPTRKRKMGRMPSDYIWVPTVRVVRIDRTPISRQWTGTDQRLTNAAISVESQDSIGFSVGMNITAFVDEKDTAKFLYYYRAKELKDIVDSNIRGYVQMQLSERFASYDLKDVKLQKNEIVEATRTETMKHFKEYGITITALGMSEGLEFEKDGIQQAIDDAYVAQMSIQKAKEEAEALVARAKGQADAQAETNRRLVSEAVGQRQAAEEYNKAIDAQREKIKLEIELMNAETNKIMATKWTGNGPTTIIGDMSKNTSPMIYNLNGSKIGQ